MNSAFGIHDSALGFALSALLFGLPSSPWPLWFYGLAGLVLLQGFLSLIEGFRHYAFVVKALREPISLDARAPKVAVIAPCKGIDPGLEGNLTALFELDYPDYQVIFVIADADDPARPVIEEVMRRNRGRSPLLVVAGASAGRSEKVNNLLHGLDRVSGGCEVFAFVDSDARVRPDWLAALVVPLTQLGVGAATGYRWYLPERGGFWPALLSAWNGSVATTLGDHGRNFAWGGSTAIRRDTFDRFGVREQWSGAASDDYVLTRAVRTAGLRIVYAPRCLALSREDVGLARLLEFTTRQIIITRVYHAQLWWLGIISHSLFNTVFFGGLALVAASLIWPLREASAPPTAQNPWASAAAALLGLIYLLGLLKGALRLLAAREALPAARNDVLSLWWMYCLLWPVVSLVFQYNFIKSATTRRITWRGVCYELRSPGETVIRKKTDEG